MLHKGMHMADKFYIALIMFLLGIVGAGFAAYEKEEANTTAVIKSTVADELRSVNLTIKYQNDAIKTNQEAIKQFAIDSKGFHQVVDNRLDDIDKKLERFSVRIGIPSADKLYFQPNSSDQ